MIINPPWQYCAIWRKESIQMVFFLMISITLTGCLGFIHPIQSFPEDETKIMASVEQDKRDEVTIFIFGGTDILDISNLNGLVDQINRFGFNRTYLGSFIHLDDFGKEARAIAENHPRSRFAVIGYDLGVKSAIQLAYELSEDEIPVDFLLLLDSRGLKNAELPQLPGSMMVQTIQAEKKDQLLQTGQNSEPIILNDSGHYGVPTHPVTIKCIEDQLLLCANRVPNKIKPGVIPNPLILPAPTPREINFSEKSSEKDWDFLSFRQGDNSSKLLPNKNFNLIRPKNEAKMNSNP